MRRAIAAIAALAIPAAANGQLLDEQLKPLATHILDLLTYTKAPVGSTCEGFDLADRLVVQDFPRSDRVNYRRAGNTKNHCRVHLIDIRWLDPDPKTIEFERIVLGSRQRAEAVLSQCNRTAVEQTFGPFEKSFAVGQSESEAVEAGFSATSTTSVEAGGEVYGGTVSQEFSTTVSAAWTRETGRTEEETTGISQEIVVSPYTCVEAKFTWSDVDLQYRITADQKADAKVEVGRRRHRGGHWGWTSGSPRTWDSIEHLIMVAERKSPDPRLALFGHYREHGAAPKRHIARIRKAQRRTITTLTPRFKGAADIKIDISCTSLQGAATDC